MNSDPANQPLTPHESTKVERLEQRVAELEMLLLHMQRDYGALNEVVLRQGRTLDNLQREVENFNARLKYWQHASEQASQGEEPPPPHY